MNDIIIKEFSVNEKESSINLLKATFPNASDENTFRWRYETYHKHKPLIIIALSGDKVLSFVSMIPWKFNYLEKELIGYQACEGATDFNFRNRGLLTRMNLYAINLAIDMGIDFYFAFPSRMSYGPTYRSGYTPVIKFNFRKRYILNFTKIKNRIESDKNFFTDEDDFIWEQDKISPVFDSYYHNWRYNENPFDYDTLVYSENNNKAVFVIRNNKSLKKKFGIIPRKVMLVDFQTTSFYEEFLENAFNILFKSYSLNASYITTFFNLNTVKGRILSKYFKSPANIESRVLCVKPIRFKDKKILFNSALWDLMPHVVDYY